MEQGTHGWAFQKGKETPVHHRRVMVRGKMCGDHHMTAREDRQMARHVLTELTEAR